MNIRLAKPEDVAALVTIENQQPRCAQWGATGWQTELAEKSARIFCMQEKTVIGFIALRFAAGTGEILNVGVSPEWVRRNIGFSLLSHALTWVRNNGGEEFSLEVAADNVAAIRLYEKAGFTPVGRRKKFYPDGQDALIMGIKL